MLDYVRQNEASSTTAANRYQTLLDVEVAEVVSTYISDLLSIAIVSEVREEMTTVVLSIAGEISQNAIWEGQVGEAILMAADNLSS